MGFKLTEASMCQGVAMLPACVLHMARHDHLAQSNPMPQPQRMYSTLPIFWWSFNSKP